MQVARYSTVAPVSRAAQADPLSTVVTIVFPDELMTVNEALPEVHRRLDQKLPVDMYFLGYGETAQMTCLSLMAKKIAVSQSTSGDMPETGLDILNQDGDSIEVALAKKLVA